MISDDGRLILDLLLDRAKNQLLVELLNTPNVPQEYPVHYETENAVDQDGDENENDENHLSNTAIEIIAAFWLPIDNTVSPDE